MLVASDGTFTPLISCLLPPIEGYYIASCINEDNGQNVKGDDDCDDDGGVMMVVVMMIMMMMMIYI